MADCFLKVRAHTESNPVFIKSNLLLKALDSAIPDKSPIKYYAAILELVKNPEELVQQEASVLLLACSLQAVPIALIQKEFSEIKSSILCYIHKESPFLSKYSIKILEKLVQVITKEEWTDWGEKIKAFTTLSDLVFDANENSRKQACSSLAKLLRKGLISVQEIKSYLIKEYNETLDMQNRHVKSETLANCLVFLSVFLQLIPLKDILPIADKIIGLCLNGMSASVTTKAYLVLETLFAALNLPRDIILNYLKHLLSCPVLSGGNEELQIAYIQCLTQALTYFNKTDTIECYKILAQGISTISEFLLSNQFSVQHSACSSLKSVIARCISPAHAEELDPTQELLLSFDVLNIEDQGIKPIQKINAIMVYLLNDRFTEILEIIFPVLSVYCQQLGSKSAHILQRLLIELDAVAIKWCDNEKFKELISSVINTIGCSQFFSILPLRPHLVPIESQNFLEHSRSWLLQVISSGLQSGDLMFFFNNFFSIYEQLEWTQNQYLGQGLIASGKKFTTLINQLWACFPELCDMKLWSPEEQAMLQAKLPVLTNLMRKSHEVRVSIIVGLEKCLKPVNFKLFQEVEDKIVPILFNNYLTSPEKPILSFLKNYPMTSSYAEKMVKRLIQKILESRNGNKGKDGQLLMDLLIRICMKLKSLDLADRDVICRFILAYIESSDGKEQKKAYRVVRSLIDVDVEVVEKLLSTGEIKICNEVARKDRLKVYHELMMKQPVEKVLPMLNKYLLEIMHCLKGHKKAKDLCKSSLVVVSKRLLDSSLFMNLYNSVLAGLASNIDSTKSSSVEVLKIILKSFAFGQESSIFNSETEMDSSVFSLTSVISLMIKDPSKEVVRSAIKFLKETVPLLSQNSAQGLCGGILTNIFEKNNELSGKLKQVVKFLIEKLMKKCGFEFMSKIFPSDHLKLLHHIYKESKKKPKKTEKKKEEDMEIDENQLGYTKKKSEKQETEPREYHFMNPLDIPASHKKKIQKLEDQVQAEKFVFNEDDDEASSSDEAPKKKIKLSENSEKIKKNDKKPFAFVQYTPEIINKRKAAKLAGKMNKVVDKAKLGVLKGLKARKKKLS